VLKQLTSPEYQKTVAADPNLKKYPVVLDIEKKNLKALADGGGAIRHGGPIPVCPGGFRDISSTSSWS
jgi:hypothetical protein